MKISEIKSIIEYLLNEEISLQNRYYSVAHDIFEHLILRELYSTDLFSERGAFKGGTALAKCYLNYHRFSVDLDFTYIHDEGARGLSKTKRNRLNREIRDNRIVPILRDVGERLKPLGVVFVYPLESRGWGKICTSHRGEFWQKR